MKHILTALQIIVLLLVVMLLTESHRSIERLEYISYELSEQLLMFEEAVPSDDIRDLRLKAEMNGNLNNFSRRYPE